MPTPHSALLHRAGLLARAWTAALPLAATSLALANQPAVPPPPATQPSIALKAARLLDVNDGKLIDRALVLIDGDRLSAVGSNLEIPAGAHQAQATRQAGFTTLRNMGGRAFTGIARRDAIEDSDIPGPRRFDAGTLLTTTGGHCSGQPSTPEDDRDGPGVATGGQAFERKVRQQFKYGAVSGNPLEDATLQNVPWVMKGGVIHKQP